MVRINAPRRRVYDAATTPELLQEWFAECAELDLPKGLYRFWGRHTFGNPGPGNAKQKCKSYRPNEEVVIDWDYIGRPTTLALRMRDDGHGTLLLLEHRLHENNSQHFFYEATDQAEVLLYNLKSFCETGKPFLKPEYRELKDPLHLNILVRARSEAVYKALTDPKEMDDWISSGAKVDLSLGGEYRYGWSYEKDGKIFPNGPEKIIRFEPNRVLLTDWRYENEPRTMVEWKLEAIANTTRVNLTHSGFGEYSLLADYMQGWTAFLCILKSKLENKPRVQKPNAVAASYVC